jgi:hypothetical protein
MAIKMMRTKNVLVSFLAVMAVCLLAGSASATLGWSGDLAEEVQVKVDGMWVNDDTISVVAGESITVKVWFTSLVCDTDVTMEVELEGEKVDAEAQTSVFDVEEGNRYRKGVSITVPYELKDERSDYLELNIELDGKDYKTVIDEIELRVQRPSYNVAIKSVSASQRVEAGETFPVDIVLKNIGYNDLDDLYVKVMIPSLGIYKTGYFGDLVALECDDECCCDDNGDQACYEDGICPYECCDDDEEDTVSGRLYLEIPYGVESGIYTLEVEVTNDDTTSKKVTDITVENDFEQNVFRSGNSIWIVNPTDNVVGYRVVAESPASVSESIVFVPAGASKTITVSPNTEGEYNFNVNVFTLSGELVETITFSGSTGVVTDDDKVEASPVVILTVILAIIFIVLLIVLIVLIGKKPEKTGEFGESYY